MAAVLHSDALDLTDADWEREPLDDLVGGYALVPEFDNWLAVKDFNHFFALLQLQCSINVT